MLATNMRRLSATANNWEDAARQKDSTEQHESVAKTV